MFQMAYSQKIKDEAFDLFVQGLSYDSIIKEMKRRRRKDFKLSRKTVTGWAEAGNWEARRAAIQRDAQIVADKKRVSIYAEILDRMSVLEEQIHNRLAMLTPVTFEGGVNSLIKIRKYVDSLRGSKNSGLKSVGNNIDTIVGVIWKVLSEDDEIGPLLHNREDYILQKIDETLEKELA